MADTISQIKLPDNKVYDINALTVNGHTVNKDVPSDAVFTDHYAWTDITGKPSTFTPSTHYHYELKTIGDQRAISTTPNTYVSKLIFQGLKTQSYIGNPGGTTGYSYLLGLRGWENSTGGDAYELAFNNNGIYCRHGATTTWGDWSKIFTSADTYTGNLTSSQVTSALGFTPTANTGTITSVKTTAGAHTTINVTSGAANFNIPTKTSHLTNDSGFVTTDTKNTAGSTDTSSKIFLIGATSQATNPQTYSQDTTYVGTDGCLYSGGSKVLTAHQDISGKADMDDLAREYSSDTVQLYHIGDLVYYDGDLYRCINGTSGGNWMPSFWQHTRVATELENKIEGLSVAGASGGSYQSEITTSIWFDPDQFNYITGSHKVELNSNFDPSNKVDKAGDTMSGALTFTKNDGADIIIPARSTSYIAGNNGNAGIYAKKTLNATEWYPIFCMDTKSGGSWAVGNYNDENLQFSYATKANRDSETNTTSIVNLRPIAGTIALTSELTWDSISGKPSSFTPAAHDHTYLNSAGTNTQSTSTTAFATGAFNVRWFTATGKIPGQPSQYGFLLTAATGTNSGENHQIFMAQPNGDLFHRGTNASSSSNPPAFKKILDSSNYTSYTRNSSGVIKVKSVNKTPTNAGTSLASPTPSIDTGYKFLCWLYIQSNNYVVGANYPVGAANPSATWWFANGYLANYSLTFYYLEIKDTI